MQASWIEAKILTLCGLGHIRAMISIRRFLRQELPRYEIKDFVNKGGDNAVETRPYNYGWHRYPA